MSDEVVISVSQASKSYRIWNTPSARIISPALSQLSRLAPEQSQLRTRITARAAASYRDFWALKDISFEVKRGESIGIIGRNGSGKSTLLQIIAGTLQPTLGTVSVAGRIGALLELGSGFNPEFTGRENVYLNATILGLTRQQIDARFDEIAAFADIGDFIEQPVKTYSSGMIMRLGFSVQTAVDPLILIVDEALSVGDAAFVAKCIKRVSDFLRDGGTLLFVSHDLGLVKQLTTKVLYLDRGAQVAYGDTAAVALAYKEALSASNASAPSADPDHYSAPHAAYRLAESLLRRTGGESVDTLIPGEPAEIAVKLQAGAPAAPSRLVYSIYNYLGLIVCSGMHELPPPPAQKPLLTVRLQMPRLRLAPGAYRVSFAVRHELEIVSWARNALHFRVTGDTTETYIYREDTTVSYDFS